MMSRLFKSFVVVVLFAASPSVYAATPTVSLRTSGDSHTVQVQVTGTPRTVLKLYYKNNLGDDKSISLGTTDADGYLTKSVETELNKIVPGSPIYVAEGAGARSSTKKWPFFGSTKISLSNTTLRVPVGESSSIQITNPTSATLQMTTSNTSVATVRLDNNHIAIKGRESGTTTVKVCNQSLADCQEVVITVGEGTSSAPALNLSQTSPVILEKKTVTIYINGESKSYYISNNTNPSIAQANASKNSVAIAANKVGTTKISVCDPDGLCGVLSVTVLAANKNTSDDAIILNRDRLDLTVQDKATVLIAGTGGYTASTNTSHVSVSITNGTRLVITGKSAGTATVKVCNGNKECATVSVKVSDAPEPPKTQSVPVPTTSTPSLYTFTTYLKPGSTGTEVTKLQQKLGALGYLKATPNGYYGPQTEKAVIALQVANKLTPLGVVGPATRALLNKK